MSDILDSMDLDINNYELNDILNLFKLPVMFDDKHLKQAKITVLQMHPDKSKLPKEYFLFFTEVCIIVFFYSQPGFD
jgi:hypothetical protein